MTSRNAMTLGALVAAGGLLATALTACSSSSGSPAGGSSTAGSSTASTSRVADVTITAADGCASTAQTFDAGALTFKITNKDATAVSEVELLQGERIVGEKENLPPGFSGQFAVTVDAGKYTMYCPGAKTEKTTLTVTGKAVSTGNSTVATLLAQGTKDYAAYVDTQVAELVTSVTAFDKTLHGTDLAAAQKAYMLARPYYEKIEPVAESFVLPGKSASNNLDTDIDVRIGDTTFSKWTGFHRIEYGIFKDKSLKGMAAYGDALVTYVKELQKLTTGLSYKPTELANGAQDLLDEVASSKITGEEEAYSLIDLLDFANNDEGAEQAFADLEPALTKIDATLTAEISAAFTSLDTLVDSYRTGSNASGFVLYNDLTAADKTKLANAVKAVQAPLSTVASKVANA